MSFVANASDRHIPHAMSLVMPMTDRSTQMPSVSTPSVDAHARPTKTHTLGLFFLFLLWLGAAMHH
jgi:hypothetical protein